MRKNKEKYVCWIILLCFIVILVLLFQLGLNQNLSNDFCRLAESERRLINRQFDLIETLKWVQDHNFSFTRIDTELICPKRVWGNSKVKVVEE